jgi:hypothetical protein
VPVGELHGAAVLDDFDCVGAIDEGLAAIEKMAHHAWDSEHIFTKHLQQKRREFEITFEYLPRVVKFYQGAQDFFTPESWRTIVQWHEVHKITRHRYQWSGGGIKDGDRDKTFLLPEPFEDLDPTPLDLIAEYKRAD